MIQASLTKVATKSTGANNWGALHRRKWGESHIGAMVTAWAAYADTHFYRYESRIGDDGVLGDPWASIGKAILELLNGELGGLDGGTVDALIRDILANEGAEVE